MHVKDVKYDWRKKRRFAINGSGIIPFVEIYSDMLEAGYDSFFSIETHTGGMKWRNSIKSLDGMLSQLKEGGWDTSGFKF